MLTNRTLQPWKGGIIMKEVDAMPSTRNGVKFDESKSQFICPDRWELTPEEIQNAWWNATDFEQFFSAYRRSLRDCREHCSDWIEDLVLVVRSCNRSASFDPHEMDVEVSLIRHEIRGMEADVAPVLKYMRKKHSQAVLQYMDRIPKHFNTHLRDRMLAARSMQLSLPLSLFAFVVGQADLKAAT